MANYGWFLVENNEKYLALTKAICEKISCPHYGAIEIQRLANSHRAFHFKCLQCNRDLFIKSFMEDPGTSDDERSLRLHIETQNLELLRAKNNSNTPRLFYAINHPFYALIEEFIDHEVFLASCINAIRVESKIDDLVHNLSALARFMAALHETPLNYAERRRLQKIHTSGKISSLFNKIEQEAKYADFLPELCSLHSLWLNDELFQKATKFKRLIHGGATLLNLFFSDEHDLKVVDFETLQFASPFVDIGAITAELKIAFAVHGGNPYFAEPYISYFLRQYYMRNNFLLTYRQFTWIQSYFMGRHLLLMLAGGGFDVSLQRWFVENTLTIWKVINQKEKVLSSSFHNIKGVFFDFYNTLVSVKDYEGAIKNFKEVRKFILKEYSDIQTILPAAAKLRKSYFRKIKEELSLAKWEHYDINLEKIWEQILVSEDIIPSEFFLSDTGRNFLKILLGVFRSSALRHFYLFPEVKDSLKILKNNNIKICILSDAQQVYIQKEIEKTGIAQYVDCFIISSEYRYRKPAKEFFQLGLDAAGLLPEEAVFVGDDLYRDIFGAKQAGMKTIYKPSKYGTAYYRECIPDEVITNFLDFPKLLGLSKNCGGTLPEHHKKLA